MSKSMRRVAAFIAIPVLAVALSACTRGHWVYDAPPAAGVQTDQGGFKLRNMLVVTGEEGGEALLIGGIHSRDEAAEVVGVRVAAEIDDLEYGEPTPVDFAESIPRGGTVYLDGSSTTFSNEELRPGRLALLEVAFGNGTVVELEVPVMSSDHAPYEEAWNKVMA